MPPSTRSTGTATPFFQASRASWEPSGSSPHGGDFTIAMSKGVGDYNGIRIPSMVTLFVGSIIPTEKALGHPKNNEPCTVVGCEKRGEARGWCKKHYTRWQRHGDPLFSYGAGRRARHGHSSGRTPTYESWMAMKRRCVDSNHRSWDRYGGRGITVCDRWLHSFENFLEDMGERPSGRSIDRIDNDGNYERSNCRRATNKEQRANRSDST